MFFVSCFNVTSDLFTSFKFPTKSKGGSAFGIKYMEAVFNKEAESGELFIEFDANIWEHKLIKHFKSQGAEQITAITFFPNDGGESAASALVRILLAQERCGGYSRGACPPALLDKTMAKRTVIKQSLVNAARGLQPQAIKLEEQSQAVKLEGACNPDYQNVIARLKEALAHKTAACDTIEGKLAHKTRTINSQDKYISTLEEEQQVVRKAGQNLILENKELHTKLAHAQEQLGISSNLGQILDKAQHTAEILSSALAEERAAKRPRAAL
jgi:hypothetical protein